MSLIWNLPLLATAADMSRAVEIAAVGMTMVFAALVLLVGFLTLLPRALAVVARVWPETSESHAPAEADQFLDEEDEVLAGIGFVLHVQLREQA